MLGSFEVHLKVLTSFWCIYENIFSTSVDNQQQRLPLFKGPLFFTEYSLLTLKKPHCPKLTSILEQIERFYSQDMLKLTLYWQPSAAFKEESNYILVT